MSKSYKINKGIGRPIEFKGVKGRYIGHLAVSVLAGLGMFAMCYIAGLSVYICAPLALGLGGLLVGRVFRMSKKYGQYGLMKVSARKRVPKALLSRSRSVFIQLYSDHAGAVR